MHTAVLFATGFTLIGALLAFFFLPAAERAEKAEALEAEPVLVD